MLGRLRRAVPRSIAAGRRPNLSRTIAVLCIQKTLVKCSIGLGGSSPHRKRGIASSAAVLRRKSSLGAGEADQYGVRLPWRGIALGVGGLLIIGGVLWLISPLVVPVLCIGASLFAMRWLLRRSPARVQNSVARARHILSTQVRQTSTRVRDSA